MNWNKESMRMDYDTAKAAKVGASVVCPTCHKIFNKASYQQAFCGTRGPKNSKGKATLCKDQYWNFIGAADRSLKGIRGYALGIVSMSKAVDFERRVEEYDEDVEDIHPFSEDAFMGG